MPRVTVLPDNRILDAPQGRNLHEVLALIGLLEAPCGGRGTCGKCRVTVNGRQVLACRTAIEGDLTVELPPGEAPSGPLRAGRFAAFDMGTTTVVCYLLDEQGKPVAQVSAPNPQSGFGADVVSRLQAALSGQEAALTALIRQTMTDLLLSVCRDPKEILQVAVVGNPAMQQLFLGKNVETLTKIPYRPAILQGISIPCGEIFPCCPNALLVTPPAISAFVGADTVAGVLACDLRRAQSPTLLVDIGTNGELALWADGRLFTCSTAAGPALEGAGISCGMTARPGAIDHVRAEQGSLQCSVIGGGEATGICGSGLIDALAAALDLGLLDRRGRIPRDRRAIPLTERLSLTQEDIRQVQLAKGAIAAGVTLLARQAGIEVADIGSVLLAGAFGSCLDPKSVCRVGLLPACLQDRITAVGNAAGQGAILLACRPDLLPLCDAIARQAHPLDLARLPVFARTFAKAMELPPDWQAAACAAGFTHTALFDPAILQAEEEVRAMCRQDKCRAYGKNWTCPPFCGTVGECQAQMHRYRHGILLQTVGSLQKPIDSRAMADTESRHLAQFRLFCEAIRRQYPDALCLGSGGCRLCGTCAWPEPCRHPDKALSSMEGYGLFVTRVCREAGLPYHHGDKTITFTACVLYEKKPS